MKVAYINNLSVGLSSGTSHTNIDSSIIANVNFPMYVGAFVAESMEELQLIQSTVNGLANSGRIISSGYETPAYFELLGSIPQIFAAPVFVRTYKPGNNGEIGCQEATENVLNTQQVYLPQQNDIKAVTFSHNNIKVHYAPPNLSGESGYSTDGGNTWTSYAYGFYIGFISGYVGRVDMPVYAPDFSKVYRISVYNGYSSSSDPYTHTVSITANSTSLLTVSASTQTALQNLFDVQPMPTPSPDSDPYDDLPIGGDDPLPGGGAVGIPGFPGLTATSAGVIGLFCPSVAQMQQLADFMWTDFGGTGTTVEEILQEVVEALKRTISSPLDYIVGLNIIPSQGLSIGGSKNVRFGFVNSGVSMPILANQYFTVDCGSLAFDTVCGDTFLDYAPYSKFSIYLPYIGFKDVDPNDFVGHSIGVVYHGDCVTGGITAYITKDGSVMYQYSGCCALNVPLSADSWGETISGAISVATGIVAAAATGGAAGVGLAAAKGAASVAANPSLLSPQVNHSGAVSGGAGCMGVQYPFVIREAVNFHSTSGFNKESGYPAYYYKKFDEVTGYTTVLDPHVGNIENATREELNEIESLLESGVIL